MMECMTGLRQVAVLAWDRILLIGLFGKISYFPGYYLWVGVLGHFVSLTDPLRSLTLNHKHRYRCCVASWLSWLGFIDKCFRDVGS